MLKHVRFALWPLLAALVLFFSMGCGPPWVVVVQAVPNPFVNQRQFSLEPLHMENLTIGEKSEAAWQAEKDGEQRGSWQEDKSSFATNFITHLSAEIPELRMLAGPPPDARTFIIRPIVTFIEPGFYAYVASRSTQVRMTLQILNTAGVILDEIKIEVAIAATLTNPSSGGRLRDAGDKLGDIVAKYLRTRVFPE
jgi:hypothetical protein